MWPVLGVVAARIAAPLIGRAAPAIGRAVSSQFSKSTVTRAATGGWKATARVASAGTKKALGAEAAGAEAAGTGLASSFKQGLAFQSGMNIGNRLTEFNRGSQPQDSDEARQALI
jgi:hypothetical protein